MRNNINMVSGFLRAMAPVTPEFPRIEGDFLIIGPECFTLVDDQSVISWRGQNYAPQRPTLAVRWHNAKITFKQGPIYNGDKSSPYHGTWSWIGAILRELS